MFSVYNFKRYVFILGPILAAVLIYLYIYATTYGYILIETDKEVYVSINYPNNYKLYDNQPILVNAGKNTVFIKIADSKYMPFVTYVNVEYKKTITIKPRFYINPNLTKIDLYKPIFLYDDQKTSNYQDNQLQYITKEMPVSLNTDDIIGKIEYLHMVDENRIFILVNSVSHKILYKFDISTQTFTPVTGNIYNIAFFKDTYVFTVYNDSKYEMYMSSWGNNDFKYIGVYDMIPIFIINQNKMLIVFNANNKIQSKLTIMDLNTFDVIEKQNNTNMFINAVKSVDNGFLIKGIKSGKYTLIYITFDLQDKNVLAHNAVLSLTDYYLDKFYFIELNNNNISFFIKSSNADIPDLWAGLKNKNILFKDVYIDAENKIMYLYDSNSDVYKMNIE